MPGRSEPSEQQPLSLLPFNSSTNSSRNEPEKSEAVRLGLQTIGVADAGELEEAIEAVDPKSGETLQQGIDDTQLEEPELAFLPQCYSSPAADPSEGSWKKVGGGVKMSPTTGKHLWRCVSALR